jgi:hypothetical protein
MARVRLLEDSDEGSEGDAVDVSRSRASDLVNGGQAVRAVDLPAEDKRTK